MAGANSPLPRRLNGRPAACDACRSRKVACDHTRPVCNRCRKRRQAAACVYSEAALAQSPARRDIRPASVPGEAEARTSRRSASPARPLANGVANGPGYLGFTSHTNVLEETRNSLSLLDGSRSRDVAAENGPSLPSQGVSFAELPRPLRETCLAVLQYLPPNSDDHVAFDKDLPQIKGWAYMAVDRIYYALRDTFGDVLRRGGPGLVAVADMLCANTARPFSSDDPDPERWLDQFTGANLRWESLGLVFAHLARVSDIVDALRPRRLHFTPGKESIDTARRFLGYCIDIARHFTDGNDLLLDMCRRKASLDSVVDGDAPLSSWASHGVAISMLTFMGLHDLENDASYRPSLCSENQRRIVAQVFCCDKLGVAFTGRPPLIARRYCLTPLPLDLRDEDLAADEITLMRAFQALDDRGWNTEGGLYPATVVRARCMIAFVREEISEVALSKQAHTTIEHLRAIKDHQMQTVGEFPASVVYNPRDLTSPDTDTDTLYIRIIIWLEHLQNLFFVERLLLRQGQPDEGDLLAVSFAMVSLTLKFWTNKDRFSNTYMRRNFEWLLIAYGTPAGGILCQELLHPTFAGAHPKEPGLSRSSIIQQLSLLVGFLDWVRPSAPNGDLCVDSKAIIKSVLDHHLNSLGGPAGAAPEAPDWGFFNQPDFSFELLDTFDWLRTDAQ